MIGGNSIKSLLNKHMVIDYALLVMINLFGNHTVILIYKFMNLKRQCLKKFNIMLSKLKLKMIICFFLQFT